MDNDKIVEMLIRMDEKLNTLVTTDNDHETRLRDLEKNDLGRFIPMAIGLGTLVSLAVSFLK